MIRDNRRRHYAAIKDLQNTKSLPISVKKKYIIEPEKEEIPENVEEIFDISDTDEDLEMEIANELGSNKIELEPQNPDFFTRGATLNMFFFTFINFFFLDLPQPDMQIEVIQTDIWDLLTTEKSPELTLLMIQNAMKYIPKLDFNKDIVLFFPTIYGKCHWSLIIATFGKTKGYITSLNSYEKEFPSHPNYQSHLNEIKILLNMVYQCDHNPYGSIFDDIEIHIPHWCGDRKCSKSHLPQQSPTHASCGPFTAYYGVLAAKNIKKFFNPKELNFEDWNVKTYKQKCTPYYHIFKDDFPGDVDQMLRNALMNFIVNVQSHNVHIPTRKELTVREKLMFTQVETGLLQRLQLQQFEKPYIRKIKDASYFHFILRSGKFCNICGELRKTLAHEKKNGKINCMFKTSMTKKVCKYTFCEQRSFHFTKACGSLHSRCEICFNRGHHATLHFENSSKELEKEFMKFIDIGVYTKQHINLPDWGYKSSNLKVEHFRN